MKRMSSLGKFQLHLLGEGGGLGGQGGREYSHLSINRTPRQAENLAVWDPVTGKTDLYSTGISAAGRVKFIYRGSDGEKREGEGIKTSRKIINVDWDGLSLEVLSIPAYHLGGAKSS